MDNGGLLLALHEGIFEQPMFDAFLHRLKARTRATYVSLIFRTTDEDLLVEHYLGNAVTEHFRRIFLKKFVKDPFARHMREGRVYAFEELFDPANAIHRAFRDELMTPQGLTGHRSVRITDDSGVEAWLAVGGGEEIGASVGALMTALVPHLKVAMRGFVALDRERFRSRVTNEAFGRLNFGWFTLDVRCRIVDAANVDRLFRERSLLRRGRYDRLIPASPAIDRDITDRVKQFAADEAASPRAYNLSKDPSVDLLLAPLRDRGGQASARPVAIAYVSGDRSSSADRCSQLADLFGLTPSEARLAWAMAGGRSIAEAAVELGLTLETTRNYSKRIYSKTGSRGQADLVRNVLTSVLAIA